MEEIKVYIAAMQDSLNRKLEVLKQLTELTQNQTKLLAEESMDAERFDRILDNKSELIKKLEELDRGFDALYAKAGEEIKQNKYQYQQQILQLQNSIRSITDTGVRLQEMERRNRDAFQHYLGIERQQIRSFHTNNRMTNSYHQNMANQHRDWQTYFLDQKK